MSYKTRKFRIQEEPVSNLVRDDKRSKGDIVYEYIGHDYGLSRDDTKATGHLHKSVTLEENGSGPFFTIPVHNLVEIHD